MQDPEAMSGDSSWLPLPPEQHKEGGLCTTCHSGFLLRHFVVLVSSGRIWQDASSAAGTIIIHIHLLFSRNSLTVNQHLLAEITAPSHSNQVFSEFRSWQHTAQSEECEEHNNVGKCHFPGFSQPCLHNGVRDPPPITTSAAHATNTWRKAFSFLAAFDGASRPWGNTNAHPRCKKVPWKAGKSKFSWLYLFKMQQFNSSLKARHYAQAMRRGGVDISHEWLLFLSLSGGCLGDKAGQLITCLFKGK